MAKRKTPAVAATTIGGDSEDFSSSEAIPTALLLQARTSPFVAPRTKHWTLHHVDGAGWWWVPWPAGPHMAKYLGDHEGPAKEAARSLGAGKPGYNWGRQ